MILDEVKEIKRYKGICTGLDHCIAFIENNNLDALPLGKTDIDEDCYVSVFDYVIDEKDERLFEAHMEWGDIHFCLMGKEEMEFMSLDKMEVSVPYVKDIVLGKGMMDCKYVVDDEHMCIVFSNDAHKVKGIVSDPHVKKIVFKFRLDN